MPQFRSRLIPVSKRLLAIAFLALPTSFRPAAAARSAPPDSIAADSTRVVRTLEETVVRAARLDALSSATRLRLSRESLRTLPVDGLAQTLALQPGVVVDGDLIHVRGARPGELAYELDGISLSEPLRGRAPDLPLIALESAELVSGGLAPENGGGLAGTLLLRPMSPGEHWSGRTVWHTDGGADTRYDRTGVLLGGPIGAGLGLALAGEGLFNNGSTPNLRTPQRHKVMGAAFGWRADNRMAAMARIEPVRTPGRFAVQGFLARRVEEPFNPMYSLDGFTTPCPDESCLYGPAYSPTPAAGERWAPYNAADHAGMTETRRAGVILSAQRLARRDRTRLSLGWNSERRITSLDGTDDESYLVSSRGPVFGLVESPTSDPFHVYLGDNPYFRRSVATWMESRLEWRHDLTSNGFVGGGLAATHQKVELRELDRASSLVPYDSLRLYVASAPGAYGWVSSRWVSPGLILDSGARVEWFTPGRDAESMPHADPIRDIWTFSPRLGMVFPLSLHNAVQVSYVRISQPPGRDFLYDSRTRRIDPRRPQGNPDLLPSTAISYELSLKHRRDERWTGRISLFYRDLFRQVSARTTSTLTGTGPNPRTFVLHYASDDAARAQGFELMAGRDDPGHSSLALTYTWMQTEGSESFEDGVPYYPLTLPQPPAAAEHPLAWDQRHRVTLVGIWTGRSASAAWTTVLGSGLPWTPALRRTVPADLSLVHSARLGWSTFSDLTLRARAPGRLRHASVGIEVRNVFDFRGARRVSEDGYPNRSINTAYDDYAAYRAETHQGGGAYWNDSNGDGIPGWTRVDDPRLDYAPRTVRMSIETDW